MIFSKFDFIKGSLPWSHLEGKNQSDTHYKILNFNEKKYNVYSNRWHLGAPFCKKYTFSFNYDNLKSQLNEEDVKLFEEKIFPYGYEINPLSGDIYFQDGMLGGIEFKRDNIMYDEKYVSYDLIYDTAVNVVQIPFSQKFENDMYHNDMLQTQFVEKTKQSLVNPIIDMEKDVYLPAIQERIGEQINAKYKDCYKIIFNLHFREHRDTMVDGNKEEWKCDRDCYWNGTRTLEREYKDEDGNPMVKKIVDLKGRVYNYNIENEDGARFMRDTIVNVRYGYSAEPILLTGWTFDQNYVLGRVIPAAASCDFAADATIYFDGTHGSDNFAIGNSDSLNLPNGSTLGDFCSNGASKALQFKKTSALVANGNAFVIDCTTGGDVNNVTLYFSARYTATGFKKLTYEYGQNDEFTYIGPTMSPTASGIGISWI